MKINALVIPSSSNLDQCLKAVPNQINATLNLAVPLCFKFECFKCLVLVFQQISQQIALSPTWPDPGGQQRLQLMASFSQSHLAGIWQRTRIVKLWDHLVHTTVVSVAGWQMLSINKSTLLMDHLVHFSSWLHLKNGSVQKELLKEKYKNIKNFPTVVGCFPLMVAPYLQLMGPPSSLKEEKN